MGLSYLPVTSLAEVWIEILFPESVPIATEVTSLAEVWIEIIGTLLLCIRAMSLPLRKCGLKSAPGIYQEEIPLSLPLRKCGLKSTDLLGQVDEYAKSLPLRKCGLK